MTALLRPKTPADLDRARAEIGWIDDGDLRDLETKSRPGAALLGFFTWGGGRLYVGDGLRGLGLVLALVAWVMVSPYLPAVLGPLLYMLVGGGAALWSYHGARAVNRFVATRNDLALRSGPDPSAYRLLAAAAAVDPGLAPALPVLAPAPAATGPHAPLIERLRKLHALRKGGVIDDTELRDRKVDLLSEAAPATRAELDDLLYALLPLADEAVLAPEDFEFLKQLGGAR